MFVLKGTSRSTMKQPRMIVTVADKRVRKTLVQLLRAAFCNVKTPRANEDVEFELERGEPCALMVIDSGYMERAGEGKTSRLIEHVRRAGGKVLMINEGRLENALPQLFRAHGVTNLIAKRSEIAILELLVTVNKLLSPNIFGIEKYLPWGTRVMARTVHDSRRREEISAELHEFIHIIGCGDRLGTGFLTAADELVTNAIYNAPVDAHGKRLYRHIDRNEQVQLSPGSEVTIKYACDGQRLALSVSDNFGSFDRETLISYLERCFAQGDDQVEQKQGGAGIGLYITFRALNTFVVNIVPGERTEMLGFIEIAGSYREYVERETSFHVFTAGI